MFVPQKGKLKLCEQYVIPLYEMWYDYQAHAGSEALTDQQHLQGHALVHTHFDN